MVPAHLPEYVVETAEWFGNSVADPGKSIRMAARRPIRDLFDVEGALLVRSGLVAITAVDGSGFRQTLGLRYPGELIFPFCTARRVIIEAVHESDVDIAAEPALRAALAGEPRMQSLLRSIASREQAISYEWLARLGVRDALSRLAHLICETFYRMGVDQSQALRLPFNQQQLGEITGQTNVNVNRMLAELDRTTLIDRHGRAILVNDWSALSHLARFNSAYLDCPPKT